METQTKIDPNLVSKCGLFCGNCGKLKKGKCPGCLANEKASWCKIRTCCIENGYNTCADCKTSNPKECKKINNFISTIFSVIFKSDRPSSLNFIKENGRDAFIEMMIQQNSMSLKK